MMKRQQPVELRPGIRLRTWGSWDNSTPAMERKFPNQEVEATFQMEYLFYQQKKCYVMFLRFQWIIMASSVPLQLDNRPDDEQHPTSRCVACA